MRIISLKTFLLLIVVPSIAWGQQSQKDQYAVNKPSSNVKESISGKYWNHDDLPAIPFRLPPPPVGYKPEYIDFDHDGDPDAIKSLTIKDTPILWIDDDDDMQMIGDLEGDTDSDCLLIDRNKDGKYGGLGDLIIDWGDNNLDQVADMQVVVEYPATEKEKVWPRALHVGTGYRQG